MIIVDFVKSLQWYHWVIAVLCVVIALLLYKLWVRSKRKWVYITDDEVNMLNLPHKPQEPSVTMDCEGGEKHTLFLVNGNELKRLINNAGHSGKELVIKGRGTNVDCYPRRQSRRHATATTETDVLNSDYIRLANNVLEDGSTVYAYTGQSWVGHESRSLTHAFTAAESDVKVCPITTWDGNDMSWIRDEILCGETAERPVTIVVAYDTKRKIRAIKGKIQAQFRQKFKPTRLNVDRGETAKIIETHYGRIGFSSMFLSPPNVTWYARREKEGVTTTLYPLEGGNVLVVPLPDGRQLWLIGEETQFAIEALKMEPLKPSTQSRDVVFLPQIGYHLDLFMNILPAPVTHNQRQYNAVALVVQTDYDTMASMDRKHNFKGGQTKKLIDMYHKWHKTMAADLTTLKSTLENNRILVVEIDCWRPYWQKDSMVNSINFVACKNNKGQYHCLIPSMGEKWDSYVENQLADVGVSIGVTIGAHFVGDALKNQFEYAKNLGSLRCSTNTRDLQSDEDSLCSNQ